MLGVEANALFQIGDLMGENRKPLQQGRQWLLALLLAILTASTVLAASPTLPQATPPGVASTDALLTKLRRAYPNADILRVELQRGTTQGGPDWLYAVKLFPKDGRILKLVIDARTLALVESIGGGGGGAGGGQGGRHIRYPQDR